MKYKMYLRTEKKFFGGLYLVKISLYPYFSLASTSTFKFAFCNTNLSCLTLRSILYLNISIDNFRLSSGSMAGTKAMLKTSARSFSADHPRFFPAPRSIT